MENRFGLVVDACLTQANGHAERLAALAMIEKRADRPSAIAGRRQRLSLPSGLTRGTRRTS